MSEVVLVPAPNGFFCQEDPGEPGHGHKRWSINLMEARLLSEMFRGQSVLEIGTGLGVSTDKLASTAKIVHTVDIDEWVETNIVPTLPKNVVFYKDISKVPEGLDGAFIDGLHTFEQCTRDIKDARRIVKKGGLIVFHDLNIDQVKSAIIASRLECYEIKTISGIAFGWNE